MLRQRQSCLRTRKKTFCWSVQLYFMIPTNSYHQSHPIEQRGFVFSRALTLKLYLSVMLYFVLLSAHTQQTWHKQTILIRQRCLWHDTNERTNKQTLWLDADCCCIHWLRRKPESTTNNCEATSLWLRALTQSSQQSQPQRPFFISLASLLTDHPQRKLTIKNHNDTNRRTDRVH